LVVTFTFLSKFQATVLATMRIITPNTSRLVNNGQGSLLEECTIFCTRLPTGTGVLSLGCGSSGVLEILFAMRYSPFMDVFPYSIVASFSNS
jgi:hypothetical protein